MKPNYKLFITICDILRPPMEPNHRLLSPSHACSFEDLISLTYVKDQSGICYLKWFRVVLSSITAMCLWTICKNYGQPLMGWAGLMHRILENMSAEPGFKSTEIFFTELFM